MSTKDSVDVSDVEENGENEEIVSSNTDTPDTLRILEALLFASDELLNVSRIKAILPGNPDAKQIRKLVDKINVQLQKERHPFEVVEIGGGYQFRTVAYYHPWVRQIFKEKAAKKLSMQALECLAIIAYKQPISKAEIEAVRGVVSDGAMKTLLEKKLVTISGRSDKPGRPLQYSTTGEFIRYFGLNKIEDLPRIEEFEAIAREKIDDLSLDELRNGEQGGDSQDEPSDEEINETDSQELQDLESVDQQSSGSEPPPPEPTAVFEVKGTVPENAEESSIASAESAVDLTELSDFEPAAYLTGIDQFDNGDEEIVATNSPSVKNENSNSRKNTSEKVTHNPQDLSFVENVEAETAEISGTKRDNILENDIIDDSESLEEIRFNETVEVDSKSLSDDSSNEEVIELDMPLDNDSDEDDDEFKPQKKGFFAKIRKKKNEELDE